MVGCLLLGQKLEKAVGDNDIMHYFWFKFRKVGNLRRILLCNIQCISLLRIRSQDTEAVVTHVATVPVTNEERCFLIA